MSSQSLVKWQFRIRNSKYNQNFIFNYFSVYLAQRRIILIYTFSIVPIII
ncbi:hypothetical protein X975_15915, partial [Stegodyphus mimosarum]